MKITQETKEKKRFLIDSHLVEGNTRTRIHTENAFTKWEVMNSPVREEEKLQGV